jgi:hypothetical protein
MGINKSISMKFSHFEAHGNGQYGMGVKHASTEYVELKRREEESTLLKTEVERRSFSQIL